MREFTVNVFDENIAGTTPRFTSSQYDDVLGSADTFELHAVTQGVSGTTTILTVDTQHSCNGLDWLNLDAGAINAVTAVNDGSFWFAHSGLLSPPLSLVRFRITLSGAAPACRLKLMVCCRSA